MPRLLNRTVLRFHRRLRRRVRKQRREQALRTAFYAKALAHQAAPR